jgi:hypothetical protein
VTRGKPSKNVLIACGAFLLLCTGYALGFIACVNSKSAAPSKIRAQQLLPPGDASPDVRTGVLASLRAFQDGYVQRDSNRLDSFMNRLFSKTADALVLGTEGGNTEWVRGDAAAAQFIKTDWQQWGDVRLNVDDSLIWSSGDVAWVAGLGSVRFSSSERPIRFTAVLTRNKDQWSFRQIQFQWDDSEPGTSDLLHLRTWLAPVRHMFHREP